MSEKFINVEGLRTIKNWIKNTFAKQTDIPTVPTNLSAFTNDTNFITNTVNNLTNYYKKNETYTQTEINNLIGGISSFSYLIVTTLPTTGQGNVLYLKGPIGSGSDKYEEYVYANNTFVKIGDTSIDLSNYVQTTDSRLSDARTPLSHSHAQSDITGLSTALSGKQDTISDLATIRSGAALGATALQTEQYTGTYNKPSTGIPKSDLESSVQTSLGKADTALQTHQDISGKQDTLVSGTNIKTINNNSILGSGNITIEGGGGGETMYYFVPSSAMTRVQNATKGVAPYSTSYYMTDITIDSSAGIEWKEGALYRFQISDSLVGNSSYRNVRIRIGESGSWIPICSYAGSASAQYTIWAKSQNQTFVYETRFFATGGLTNVNYDSNTTYTYLTKTVIGDTTSSPVQIDSNGYGAKYSLIFPTTPLSSVIDGTERWSSPMMSSSNGTTKTAYSGKLYIDSRKPLYVYTANIAAGAKPVNSLYQAYGGNEMFRYLGNTSTNYITARKRVYMWLKNFDPTDMSFYADATLGNVMSEDKISTRFPSTTTGDVYLLCLGWNNATWYYWQPNYEELYKIYKYTPSTGVMTKVEDKQNTTIILDDVFEDANPFQVTFSELLKIANITKTPNVIFDSLFNVLFARFTSISKTSITLTIFARTVSSTLYYVYGVTGEYYITLTLTNTNECTKQITGHPINPYSYRLLENGNLINVDGKNLNLNNTYAVIEIADEESDSFSLDLVCAAGSENYILLANSTSNDVTVFFNSAKMYFDGTLTNSTGILIPEDELIVKSNSFKEISIIYVDTIPVITYGPDLYMAALETKFDTTLSYYIYDACSNDQVLTGKAFTLASSNGGTIYYTTDGTEPTALSNKYSNCGGGYVYEDGWCGAIQCVLLTPTVATNYTIKAIAIDDDGNKSDVLTFTVSIEAFSESMINVNSSSSETMPGVYDITIEITPNNTNKYIAVDCYSGGLTVIDNYYTTINEKFVGDSIDYTCAVLGYAGKKEGTIYV